MLKVSRSLTHPPQNDGPLNFFCEIDGNHILMANFSKFSKYQTFNLIKLHNLSKDQLADRILKLWKSCAYGYRLVEHTFFWNSDILIFPTFKQLMSVFIRQKLQVLKQILKVLLNFYRFTNIYDGKFLDNETTGLWNFF